MTCQGKTTGQESWSSLLPWAVSPVLPEAAQLLHVCPARHSGHWPVPILSDPLGTLLLLPSHRAAGQAVPALGSEEANPKRVGEGPGLDRGPELGVAGWALHRKSPQSPQTPKPQPCPILEDATAVVPEHSKCPWGGPIPSRPSLRGHRTALTGGEAA